MSKINLFFLGIITAFILLSCQKADKNGELDGFWKLMRIEYVADGTTEDLKDKHRFMAIQLDLLQLRGEGSHYARFVYECDSLYIKMIDNASDSLLQQFGMNAQEQSFAIERLNDKRLVLKSVYSKLIFKKF